MVLVTVDVCVHLQFEYGHPWGVFVQQQLVLGIVLGSVGEMAIFLIVTKKSQFGPISIVPHSFAFIQPVIKFLSSH